MIVRYVLGKCLHTFFYRFKSMTQEKFGLKSSKSLWITTLKVMGYRAGLGLNVSMKWTDSMTQIISHKSKFSEIDQFAKRKCNYGYCLSLTQQIIT